MKKPVAFFVFLFFCVQSLAQTYTLSGKIFSKEKPVENATIYLLREKDSSIINYTNSGKEGGFHLKVKEISDPSLFKVEMDKYTGFQKKLDKITQDLDFSTIVLEKLKTTDIAEVVVSASPVKIKKDTIEFKASALRVRPDSKIEELLKEIPGVEISNEGKITVNGKDVDQVLINGKPFFDKDGKIALKNLPADIIKNIQFTTTKTKEEELSGKAAKSSNATINFNIDEKKNQGFLSRLNLGYGSDKRYESSLLASYFKGDTKISLLGSSNNINSQGFTSDEVFDSMGYGRNSWLMQGGTVVRDGNMVLYSMPDGGNKGILKSHVLGLNYSDQISKEVSLETLSLMYLKNDLETQSKVNRTTLLPDYSLETTAENKSRNDTEQFSFENNFEIKADSLTSIYFAPGFSMVKTKGLRSGKNSTFREGSLLNDNLSSTRQESLQQSFNPSIYFVRKFKSNSRRQISANVSNRFEQSDDENFGLSETHFFDGSGTDDSRNQFSKRKNSTQNYQFAVSYQEPLSDSLSLYVGLNYDIKNNRNKFDVHDFDMTSGAFDQYNNLLSNVMEQKINEFTPNVMFEIEKKKLNFWSGINFRFTHIRTGSDYLGTRFFQETQKLLPSYFVGTRYTIKENLRLNINLNSGYTIPTAVQLSTFTDNFNPLVSITGNPYLKNTWTTSAGLYLSNAVLEKNINYYLSSGFSYRDNDIVNAVNYDNAGKQWNSYVNVDGNKTARLSVGFTKTYKWNENKNKFSVNPYLGLNYAYSRGIISNQMFTSKITSLRPGLNFTYEIKDRLTVKPSYEASFSNSRYRNYVLDKAHYAAHRLKLELTNYFFDSDFVIGNDFEYNTNSFIAPGFRNAYYFWNTSVGYSFFKKQLTAKVKVYDVLNQNQSVSKIINPGFIEDRDDLILKRYIMFSLSLKLNKFSGEK